MNRVLLLERKTQRDKSPQIGSAVMTPPIDESYWRYRVRLTDSQSIVGFPKFFTVGIGFSLEEDWNTNLPYTSDAKEIFDHIKHNKADDSIGDEDCLTAIRMIQHAAKNDEAR